MPDKELILQSHAACNGTCETEYLSQFKGDPPLKHWLYGHLHP